MEFISLSSQGAQLNTFNHPAAPRRSPWSGSFGGHCIPIHFFLVRLFLCGSLRSYWKPERMEANSACLWLGQARLSIIIMELTKILGAENNSGKDHIVQQPEPIPVHPERADPPTNLLLGKRGEKELIFLTISENVPLAQSFKISWMTPVRCLALLDAKGHCSIRCIRKPPIHFWSDTVM